MILMLLLLVAPILAYDAGHRLDALDRLDPDTRGSLTVYQLLRRLSRDPSDAQFAGFTSLLGSRTCGGQDLLTRYLDNPTASLTLWLPTDQAIWNALEGRRVPLRGWTCDPNDPLGMHMSDNDKALESRSWCMENPVPRDPSMLANLPPLQFLPCIRDILTYHLTPDRQILLLGDLDGLTRATAIPQTALTTLTSWLVNLQPDTHSQGVVIEQRRSDQEDTLGGGPVESRLLYGALPPSRVIRANITCANGVVHVIDRMLLPPTNLTRTLELLQMPFYLGALRSAGQEWMISREPSVTIFLPDAAMQREPGSPEQVYERLQPVSFNYADYTFPNQLIYANRTSGPPLNITSLSGFPSFVTYSAASEMLLNGTMRIVRPNILLQNGVLHIFANRTF